MLTRREPNPCCVVRLGPFCSQKQAFYRMKRQNRVAILSEHDMDMLGGSALSGAQLELSVPEFHVKASLPLRSESQVSDALIFRSSKKEMEGDAHHLCTLLLAASPRDLVSKDTKSCRADISLLKAEIPEGLYGREIALRQAQRKQH